MKSQTMHAPVAKARLAGVLYLLVIAGGAFADLAARQQLIVHGDAAATAHNILAHEQIFRLGFVADLLPLVCNVILAALFASIFRVVSQSGVILVIGFSLVGSAVQAMALLFHIAPLLILKDNGALASLDPAQAAALAYLSLRLQVNGYSIALIFFGCFGVSIGWLIWCSKFLPRVLGALMMVGGLCYFTNSLLVFIAPASASLLLLLPCLVAELSLALWLTFAGIASNKWKLQAEEGCS